MPAAPTADVAIIMGSQSDWNTMKRAADTLDELGIGYDARIISAHRTPQRLVDFATSAKSDGFKVIIAPSFADIFYNNCFKNGILPIVLPVATVDALFAKTGGDQVLKLTVDLEQQRLQAETGATIGFEVDSFRKHCLLQGLDDIGLTLQHVDDIRAYEARRRVAAPWLFD